MSDNYESYDGTETEGEVYDEQGYAPPVDYSPEAYAEVERQVQAQYQQPYQPPPPPPRMDPIQQAHADAMIAATPALADPNSHETAAFVQIVNQAALQAGMPEAARDMRFVRSVYDRLSPDALASPADRILGTVGGRPRKVLPF